jgi:Fe2+ transport system protein FeoA
VTRIERSNDPTIKLRLLELGLGMGALVEVNRDGSRLTIRIRRATMIVRQDEICEVFVRPLIPAHSPTPIANEVAQEARQ